MQMEPTLSPNENQDPIKNSETEVTPQTEPIVKANEEINTGVEEPVKKQVNPLLEVKIDELSIEDFPTTLQKILQHDQWMKMNQLVRDLQQAFDNQFLDKLQEKKKIFIEEGGNEIDFFFAPEYKKSFSLLLREYKSKKSAYFKELEAKQKANLNRKREIIEEIKQLIDQNEHNNDSYRQFKNLQEAFHATGQVPRNESNNIWQTYKFHVERYYDFLHLNRDLREADFKHNYDEKVKIIEKAEELATHTDVLAAIRELNILHRLWKNDLGPVAREHRDELWNRFQAATKVIHQLKNDYNKNLDGIQAENLALKETILKEIATLTEDQPQNHNAWQNAIKKVNELKEKFHATGRVPKAENRRLWNQFREIGRQFNHQKNLFYKEQKSQERQFVNAKRALIEEVNTILNQPNWREHVSRMKSIQNDWKKTGRISRKISNKLWEEFKSLTNLYFDRLKNKKEALSAEDQALMASQNNFINEVLSSEAPTTPKKLENYIEQIIEQWQALNPSGNSPEQKKLLTHLTQLWDSSSLSANDKTSQKFNTQLGLIKNNAEALNKEHAFLKKKIDEINTEMIQLENNLQFFSSSSGENPVVAEVTSKIEKLSQQKSMFSDKANAVKSLKRNLSKQQENETSASDQNLEEAEH